MERVTAIELSREIETICCSPDVTVAQLDIALVLLERLGELLRSHQSAYSKKPRFVEPIDCYGISLVSAKDRDKVTF